MSYLMMQNKGKPLPSPIDGSVLKKDDTALNEAIQRLRGELIQKDSASALKSAYILGISLTQLDSQLDPQTRLRQERIASPEGRTGRASVTSASNLMLAAYRAGELTEAERLARQILLSRQASTTPPETSTYAHNAFTILGLAAASRNNIAAAKENLILSIQGIDAELSTKIGQPNFALAEALLKAGEKAVVLEYLTKCQKFDGWDGAKPKIGRYLEEIQSGQRNSFAPDHFLLF